MVYKPSCTIGALEKMYFQRIQSNPASSLEGMNGLPSEENLDQFTTSELFLRDFFTQGVNAPYSTVITPWLESFAFIEGDNPSIEEAFRGSLIDGPHQLARLTRGDWVVIYKEESKQLILLKGDHLLAIDKGNSSLSCYRHPFTPQQVLDQLTNHTVTQMALEVTDGCEDLCQRIEAIGPPTQPNSWTSCIGLATFVIRLLDAYPLDGWPQDVETEPFLEPYVIQFINMGIEALAQTKEQNIPEWDQWRRDLQEAIQNSTNCLDEAAVAEFLAKLNRLDT